MQGFYHLATSLSPAKQCFGCGNARVGMMERKGSIVRQESSSPFSCPTELRCYSATSNYCGWTSRSWNPQQTNHGGIVRCTLPILRATSSKSGRKYRPSRVAHVPCQPQRHCDDNFLLCPPRSDARRAKRTKNGRSSVLMAEASARTPSIGRTG